VETADGDLPYPQSPNPTEIGYKYRANIVTWFTLSLCMCTFYLIYFRKRLKFEIRGGNQPEYVFVQFQLEPIQHYQQHQYGMMMQLQQALKLGQSVPDINNSSTSLYFRFSIFNIRGGNQPECVFVHLKSLQGFTH